jgi:glycerol-3-phosphate acyltransferase PlsY
VGFRWLTIARDHATQVLMNVHTVSSIIIAWLAGSIPTAYLMGRAHGVDLRKVGSGNLGATNVLRTLGWKAGLIVYAIDMLKGALPVLFLPLFAGVERGWPWGVIFGIAAIVGHVRPVFLLGRGGGKGIATASGVFIALTPIPALVAMATFFVVVAISRYVSLGSLLGALVLPAAIAVQAHGVTPLVIVSICVALFVVWTHRENIGRLARGEERRIAARATQR